MMDGWHEKQQYIRVRLSPGQYITEEEEEKIILHQVNICMSVTMKMLAVSLLVVAMMALTSGAEAEVANNTEPPPTEKEAEPESTLDKEAEEPESGSDEDTEDNTDLKTDEGNHKIGKRATLCPVGWTPFKGRCFCYISTTKTWAEAQKHCQYMGGNLASVHNCAEDNWIKNFAHHNPTWLGLSDAQQEHFWFWNDGTHFSYSNWCHGEPSDSNGHQNCLQINWTDKKCWDDVQCHARKGYVCARKLITG